MKRHISSFRKILFVLIIALAGYALLSAALFYFSSSFGKAFARPAVYGLNFPVAVIGWKNFVSAEDLEKNLESVRKFYESQNFSSLGLRVDFSTEDGAKRLKIKERNLLNKMIDDRMIERLAAKNGVRLSDQDVAEQVERKMAEYQTGDELEKNLKNLYGWNLSDFREKIVKPDMYREELEKKIRGSDPVFIAAGEKITRAEKELSERKDSFENLAKKYSEGESAKNGGDLGWITFGQMVPEAAVAAYQLKKGETSPAVESSLGYHILKLTNRKTENGTEKIRLSQIFVRGKSFGQWLFEQKANLTVRIPLKDYYWDPKTRSAEFKDENLKKFEAGLEENSSGDASVLF